ncbi:GNAT family N-acetyltransferase [Microbacterium sp. 179-I 3D4 NHS]|uniref:GNAT family N-acetyltransferase n=1 Tax=Microbacterium sp. 179-I 3D4 NHS TaxID=3142381 RepID=UPI0039A2C11B
MEPVRLETERLVLAAPTPEDIDQITEACQDPEIPRWTTVPSPYTRDSAREFVELTARRWADGSHATWSMHADGAVVGSIGLHHVTDHPSGAQAELGYWVAGAARGRGYVVEAGRAVLDWAFAERGLVRVDWRAVVGNVPSARAARALGFRYEGLQRQVLVSPRGRDDGWVGGLLATDDRVPQGWPIL